MQRLVAAGGVVVVVCLCGIPGAGKSTYAARLLAACAASLVCFDSYAGRAEALEAVRMAVARGGGVVLVDDNNYYRSMRKQVHRIARDAGAGYVQVLLEPPLALCQERNAGRSGAQRIPPDMVARMHERLERPDGRGWDKAVVGEATMEELLSKAIVPTPKANVKPGEKTTSEREALDLAMRREISRRVAAAAPEERAALAAALNRERKEKLNTKS